MARLEEELATTLIARTTRTVSLTDAGRTFLPHARRLLDDSIEAANVLRIDRAGPSGSLTVTASSTFGRMFLAPYLPAFRRKHPNIQLSLKLLAKKMDIAVGQADIAVRLGPVVDPELGVRPLGQIDFMLVAAPVYLKGRKLPRTPLDLAQHDLIELRPPMRDHQLELFRDGKAHCVRCVPAFDIDDPDTAKVTCLAGGGIAMLPAFLIADDLAAKRLVRLLPAWTLGSTPINVVYGTKIAPSLRVRAYLDFLFETVGNERPWQQGNQP